MVVAKSALEVGPYHVKTMLSPNSKKLWPWQENGGNTPICSQKQAPEEDSA
jgi:hypothetical protein